MIFFRAQDRCVQSRGPLGWLLAVLIGVGLAGCTTASTSGGIDGPAVNPRAVPPAAPLPASAVPSPAVTLPADLTDEPPGLAGTAGTAGAAGTVVGPTFGPRRQHRPHRATRAQPATRVRSGPHPPHRLPATGLSPAPAAGSNPFAAPAAQPAGVHDPGHSASSAATAHPSPAVTPCGGYGARCRHPGRAG